MGYSILSCPPLVVRSVKARERAKTAELNNLSLNAARYRITGIETPTLKLHKDILELIPEDGEQHSYTTARNSKAVFFDQTPYMFSIKLPDAELAHLFSPLAAWCESADWNKDAQTLSIPINFGNDLGDFELCWEWISIDGERYRGSFSGQVFSTKLDIYTHFSIMLDEVKDRFQWIQLDLLRQTTWGWSHDSGAEGSLKTWLLIFQEIQETMGEHFKKLIRQHRRRLLEQTKMLRAEQMKKISPRLEERVVEGLQDNPNQRYPVISKVLDADTPENRFMKHILLQTLAQLNTVISKIDRNERFADIFKSRLKDWAEELSVLKQHRFWRGIGAFRGLRRASLILSQDPLYASIRRAHFLLQQGLIFLDKDLKGGIQNAAQLYEVWCFVKLDQLITEAGWQQSDEKHLPFEMTDGDFSEEREELQSGTVKFSYIKDGFDSISLSLLFQPSAGKNINNNGIWDGMMAVPVSQQPDLVLRLHRDDLPQRPVYTWIFDAKYRLHKNDAPDDAINQMHRYRDAIIWSKEAQGVGPYLREGIGAYVLYPGDDQDEKQKYPQIDSIKKTNIGAFPLRPGVAGYIPEQLKKHIEELLTIESNYSQVEEKEPSYYENVPRSKRPSIPIFAKCATRISDGMNTLEYWNRCRIYRLPEAAYEEDVMPHPQTWSFLIPTDENGEQLGKFPVLDVYRQNRKNLKKLYFEKDVYIEPKVHADSDVYWCFILGEPLKDMPELEKLPEKQIVLVQSLETDIS
ncbi:MAG: DUF2357 domain-containing protein [Candidatus Marinimicrobia bacterium]|nr:DUF2357 domain-containing protein [Candidatus Neomarinimicrobiota bacterium]